MFSKKLYYIIIGKVIFLCGISMLLSYGIINQKKEIIIFFAIILFISIIHFIFYLNKTNKKIAYFFDAIKNNDSTLYFSESSLNTPTKELNAHLNKVNKIIQEIKLKNKAQDQYYKTIIENANIGILTLNKESHILFANNCIQKMLEYPSLTHLTQLKKIDQKLFKILSPLKPFTNKIIELINERETKLLNLNASQIKLNNDTLLIVIVTNIKNELDNSEINSWIKLTKVLTHEIMNSISPINSISETLHNKLQNIKTVEPETLNNTITGLQIIEEQTKKLQNFVFSYRAFSRISNPEKKIVNVQDLFEKNLILFSETITSKKIDLKMNCSNSNLKIFVDENQISQVIYNLIKNAIESLQNKNDKKIILSAFSNKENKTIITVEDNGEGISNELISEIFIPFFSTKKEGSGVGLSLSKHIMKLHDGTLSVFSVLNKKTIFTLTF